MNKYICTSFGNVETYEVTEQEFKKYPRFEDLKIAVEEKTPDKKTRELWQRLKAFCGSGYDLDEQDVSYVAGWDEIRCNLGYGGALDLRIDEEEPGFFWFLFEITEEDFNYANENYSGGIVPID